MSGDAEINACPGRRGSWRRAVFILLLLVFLLPMAYYGSYVLWGRGMGFPSYSARALVAKVRGSTPPEEPSWRDRVTVTLYRFWSPVRWWDEKQSERRTMRAANGVWSLEDGRCLKVDLRPDGKGSVTSEDFPMANCRGEWSGSESPGGVGGTAETTIYFDYSRHGPYLELLSDGGLKYCHHVTPLFQFSYLGEEGEVYVLYREPRYFDRGE